MSQILLVFKQLKHTCMDETANQYTQIGYSTFQIDREQTHKTNDQHPGPAVIHHSRSLKLKSYCCCTVYYFQIHMPRPTSLGIFLPNVSLHPTEQGIMRLQVLLKYVNSNLALHLQMREKVFYFQSCSWETQEQLECMPIHGQIVEDTLEAHMQKSLHGQNQHT